MNLELNNKLNRYLFFSILTIIVFSILVIAAHVTTPTSQNVEEDDSTFYNITINNSDTTAPANITQVNITLPASFTFTDDTNATSATSSTFSDTATVLTWENDGLVMNLTRVQFYFNATASTPGNYNITITTLNATGAYYNNLTITVNDTTAPSSITYDSPSEANGANISRTYILVNATVTDNGIIQYVNINLYNSTHTQINSTVNSTNTASPKSVYANFSGLTTDGLYYFNVTRANDTYGNVNTTAQTYTVRIDRTAPTFINLIGPTNNSNLTSDSQNFTFNVTDLGSGVASCNLIIDGDSEETGSSINSTGGTSGIYETSLDNGDYTWSINCTDYASNTNSSIQTWTFNVNVSDDDDDDSSSSSSSSGVPTYAPTAISLSNGFTAVMIKNAKVIFKVGSVSHNLVLNSMTSSSATYTISSTPKTYTLQKSATAKYDVDGDGDTYDLKVFLESTTTTTAKIIMTTINETIPDSERIITQPTAAPNSTTNQTNSSATGTDGTTEESTSKKTKIIWLVVIVLIIIGGAVGYFIIQKRRE